MMPKCAHAHSDWFAIRATVRLTRCFVPGPLHAGVELDLPPDAAAHVTRVLRLRAGAPLRLFDGSGLEFDATLIAQARRGRTRVRVDAAHANARESPLSILLLQCLVRGERMDWIVQKSTELGVAEIMPVNSQYGVVRLDASGALRRQEHWRAIAIGACEQCGRSRLPGLHPVQTFEAACRSVEASDVPATARLLLSPDAERSLAQSVAPRSAAPDHRRVVLLIGPEGGLSDQELQLARQCGFRPCHLGPRVLRAETAPLAALASLQTLLGDLG